MVRQLTAIMFTDMVGYTALVQEDERRARADRDRQRAVLEARISAHGGRILQFYGDGTLSVFPSAIEAVRAAREIQAELREGSPIPLRIGVHTGDIIHDEEGVFGDGVNVAARIQGLSVPGGILISAKVWDEVKNQADIRTRSLGSFNLKNVKIPMEVHAVVGDGLQVPAEADLLDTRARECRSVAVLPFVNMSSDPENEFFSDGITEELINALTRVHGLQVTARTSTFAYKNRNDDIRKIGAELGVATVVEGSVRRAGNRVRVAAQLIDTRDGYHIFSDIYDRSLDDIFEIQDEIARTIVRQLETRLMGRRDPAGEDARLVKGHTHDTAAYAEYLKGLSHWRRWSPEAARTAIDHFRESLRMDEDCALPHAGLAAAYTFLGALGQMAPDEAFPRARAAAERAKELEPDAGESHLALGTVQMFYEWDFEAAYRSFQKALSLQPGSAAVHDRYSMYLKAVLEHEDAVAEAETAVKLDPLSLPFNLTLGQAYFLAGRREEAEAQLLHTLELDPTFRAGWEALGWLRVWTGRVREGLEAFEEVPRLSPNPYSVIPHRMYAHALLGNEAEVRALMERLERRREEEPEVRLEIDFALAHLALDEPETTLDYLEKAVDLRLGAVVFLAGIPHWTKLGDHPRFQAILDRVGLPRPAGVPSPSGV